MGRHPKPFTTWDVATRIATVCLAPEFGSEASAFDRVGQGPALVVRNSVAIVPDVSGEVLDVPVQANTPLKAGDVLFRIDPEVVAIVGKGSEESLPCLDAPRLAGVSGVGRIDEHMIIAHQSA
jgi:hypothetical protein